MGSPTDRSSTSPVIRLSDGQQWNRTVEVVVVGTGVAGCSTAINCAELGASVIMLEKGETTGGTSAKSGAAALVPNNKHMAALGQSESKEEFLSFLARICRPLLYNRDHPTFGLPQWEYDLAEAYFEHAGTAWSHMESLDAIRMMHAPDWPTYNDIPEDKFPLGRLLFPADDDGQMVYGQEAVDRMLAKANQLGVDAILKFRVDAVYVNDTGEVIGVRGCEDGAVKSICATKAVVFASGGFTHSERYVAEYLNGQIVGGCASVTNTGDLIPIAKSLGSPLYGMQGSFYAPIVYEQALDKDSGLISNFNCAGNSMIAVNRYGVRVGNEKATYNDRTQSHFIWDPWRVEYPNFLQFVVMDQRNREKFAYGGRMDYQGGNFIPTAGESSSYFLEGETLEALAEQFAKRLQARAAHHSGVQLAEDFVQNLRATIGRFNEFARQGRDEDFHRGETRIEKFTGVLEAMVSRDELVLPSDGGAPDKDGPPNLSLFPLSEHGPYYGIILAPGALDTKGGPKVNTQMQILDGNDEPIPGLYGVGNCVASPTGQAYFTGGCTWGPYLTYGYLAARSIVAERARVILQVPSAV